ncbi:glycosyltransferase [Jidongwangia harbinensis]|uniref:glycosyltransferase n=1 Tax=Jidongwangia harbinensis TaxID=2878561 RepID=UPI001CD970A2|nr:glycosyltransferase [Jidongwangia harbinensis]MCA2215141.1 glycosyltransferase [Jidongwangia harbinensis]
MRNQTGQDPLAVAALRAGSVESRELLARAAGATTVRDLLSGAVPDPDPWPAGELARVMALQNLRPSDRADALALCELLHDSGPVAPEHQILHVQLTFAAGDRDRTVELLRAYPDLAGPVRTALTVDLANPHAGGTGAWDFAALLPDPAVQVADGPGAPFDRLTTGYAQRAGHAERITTIVTTYRPGPELLTAVRSLAAQTWTNHEILVVDDGSPYGHDEVLRRAAALDPRIRVIRLDVNAGTYAARNAGLDAATGDYVTFQDSDDWSHPLRLETQAAPLRDDPAVFSTTSTGLRVTPELLVTRLGFADTRSYNLSSLMFRRADALRRVGHFAAVRKGADAEYVERARAVFGRPATRHLDGPPLALIRLSPASLSSSDYRPGWMHPARRSYLSAFQAWHRHLATGAAAVSDPRRCAAPRRLLGRTGRRTYDVVLAADWTLPDAGLGQLRALRARGLRAAVLHLDDFANLRHRLANFDPEMQDAVNAGEVDQIELCDDVRARLVVVRSPAVLRFPPTGPSAVRAGRVVVETGAGTWSRRCVTSSRRLFGVDPLWAPTGPAGRRRLVAAPGGLPLTAVDLPGTVDADRWRLDRRGPRADRPVAGRHCVGDRAEWRRLRDELPDPTRIDVRLLDGTGASRRAFGAHGAPRDWLVYGAGEVTLRSFLYQVDFYLHLPAEDALTDPEPGVLAAMAAGCVPVLPYRFSGTFGDAALYSAPPEVADTIRTLHGRRTELHRLSERSRAFVQSLHHHDRYAERVESLTG